MKMDITKRIEWLSKRVNLTEQDKEYVRFVMVEAVTDAVKQVNKTNDIHDVIRSEEDLKLQYNIGYNDGARAAADDILSSI